MYTKFLYNIIEFLILLILCVRKVIETVLEEDWQRRL